MDNNELMQQQAIEKSEWYKCTLNGDYIVVTQVNLGSIYDPAERYDRRKTYTTVEVYDPYRFSRGTKTAYNLLMHSVKASIVPCHEHMIPGMTCESSVYGHMVIVDVDRDNNRVVARRDTVEVEYDMHGKRRRTDVNKGVVLEEHPELFESINQMAAYFYSYFTSMSRG